MVSVGLPSIGGRCGRKNSNARVALSGSASHGERQVNLNRGVLSPKHRVTLTRVMFRHCGVSQRQKNGNIGCYTEDVWVKAETIFRQFVLFY